MCSPPHKEEPDRTQSSYSTIPQYSGLCLDEASLHTAPFTHPKRSMLEYRRGLEGARTQTDNKNKIKNKRRDTPFYKWCEKNNDVSVDLVTRMNMVSLKHKDYDVHVLYEHTYMTLIPINSTGYFAHRLTMCPCLCINILYVL